MHKKVEYKVISANEFLKAKPSGEFDREESKKVRVEIAILAADHDVLVDVRLAHANATLVDVYEFVAELGKHRSASHNKIAIISRMPTPSQDDRQFENAQFAELCAQNRGLQVGAFTDFEEAIDWLTSSVDIDINNLSRELS